MSKNVLIDEPFQLSNYTSSYRGKQKAAVPEHIFARSIKTSSSKSKNVKEGLVTVAAQADGIHLVDVGGLFLPEVMTVVLNYNDRSLVFTQSSHTPSGLQRPFPVLPSLWLFLTSNTQPTPPLRRLPNYQIPRKQEEWFGSGMIPFPRGLTHKKSHESWYVDLRISRSPSSDQMGYNSSTSLSECKGYTQPQTAEYLP